MNVWRNLSGSVSNVFFAAAILFCGFGHAVAEPLEIRVGVLKFGTVNWELNTLKHHGLDAANGFKLTTVPFASPRATQVALLGKSVDVIVGDWIWVSRQRNEKENFTLIPYSSSVGALMVPANSAIKSLADIAGKKIGIAGGPLDKSWLLVQALLKKQGNENAYKTVETKFGAPPLLSKLLERGELDGVITYWHFAARLEAAGMRRVIGIGDVASTLGIDKQVPLLGYIFKEEWADAHKTELLGFANAIRQTKEKLATSDEDWRRLRPVMRAKDDKTAGLLKAGFIAGITPKWGDGERNQVRDLYKILTEIGGPAFTRGQNDLAPGTFWAPVKF